ncbi:MFS transporter [Streptomyces sp. NPDC088745]|uniref:MFS transporter n=1 Tax=Streptomyces sp. NPDC088745 TaxID=3365884 RepID=UPI003825D3DA
MWGSVSMLGLIGGPVLGGLLVTHFSWGAVFLINVPVAVVAILAALFLMPESKGAWKKPDPVGAVLSVAGMVALVWTINEQPKDGFSHTSTVVALVVAVLGLAGFVAWELKVDEPMVPLRLFRDRDFAGGSLSLTLVQVGNGGMLPVVTQYVQFVLGYSPTEAGSAFIPMAVGSGKGGPVAQGSGDGRRLRRRRGQGGGRAAAASEGVGVEGTGWGDFTWCSSWGHRPHPPTHLMSPP